MSTPEVTCRRCQLSKEGLPAATLPGALGQQILASICADCWREWEQMEVMVINELRLNFMEPSAQDTLLTQMREFLSLGPSESDPSESD